jgi:RimJ/RimL family protein N-acetyltransferase
MTKPQKALQSIATARLTLRRPVIGDAGAIFTRYASDPAVTRYLSWPTHRSRADTEAFLAYADREWETSPAGTFLIFDKSDDRLLGSTGLSFPTATETITGYVLAQDSWGKGFATEALTAMVELAESLEARRISAGCHVDNVASRQILLFSRVSGA